MHLEKISSLAIEKSPAVIAQMTRDEVEQTYSLFRTIVRDLPYYNATAKESELAKYTASELKNHILSDPGSVIVAKIEQDLVGFCFSRKDDETIWLSWIGIHPNFRRMRIATALLEALDARAKGIGSHKIWCDSRTNNEASKLVLSSFGYHQICIVHDHWYRQDFFLWEKPVH